MFAELKKRIIDRTGFLRAHGVVILVTCVSLILLVIVGQKACDHQRREQIEDEQLRAFANEATDRATAFQSYIESANRNHETTTAILDSMTVMSENIQALADNDIKISLRVDGIAGEYRGTRTNTPETRAQTVKTRAKIPVRTREIDALKVDSELYPDK